MIPHHSIASVTSELATITDPSVRKLAESIIKAQREEIVEMKAMTADIEEKTEKHEHSHPIACDFLGWLAGDPT